ncbi:uncharacterized protein PRD47_001005 [Ara ararauna]
MALCAHIWCAMALCPHIWRSMALCAPIYGALWRCAPPYMARYGAVPPYMARYGAVPPYMALYGATHGTSNGTGDGHPKALLWAMVRGILGEPGPPRGATGDVPPRPHPPPWRPHLGPHGQRHRGPRPPGSAQHRAEVRRGLRRRIGAGAGAAPGAAAAALPPGGGTWRWLRPLLLGGAAGALSGDGILHLLPQVLGLHEHGGGGAAGAEPGGGAEPHWKLMVVLGGIYGAFVLERVGGGAAAPPPGGRWLLR